MEKKRLNFNSIPHDFHIFLFPTNYSWKTCVMVLHILFVVWQHFYKFFGQACVVSWLLRVGITPRWRKLSFPNLLWTMAIGEGVKEEMSCTAAPGLLPTTRVLGRSCWFLDSWFLVVFHPSGQYSVQIVGPADLRRMTGRVNHTWC